VILSLALPLTQAEQGIAGDAATAGRRLSVSFGVRRGGFFRGVARFLEARQNRDAVCATRGRRRLSSTADARGRPGWDGLSGALNETTVHLRETIRILTDERDRSGSHSAAV